MSENEKNGQDNTEDIPPYSEVESINDLRKAFLDGHDEHNAVAADRGKIIFFEWRRFLRHPLQNLLRGIPSRKR